MKLGTVEPRWNDVRVNIPENEYLCDDALAFIYGAIKKYGTSKSFIKELKEYIIEEAQNIKG